MSRNAIIIVAVAALQAVVAQNFTIDPTAVSVGTRATWCQGQQNTCGTLCAGNPKANDCDTNTLAFNCLCQNNSAPGLQYYLQTMPTFICNEAFKECNDATIGNAAGQLNCTNSIQKKCGTLDPNKANISGGSSPSGTGQAGSGSTNAPTSTSSKAAAPTNLRNNGNSAAAVAAGLLAYLL